MAKMQIDKLLNGLCKQSYLTKTAVVLFITGFIGWLDFITSWEWSLFVLYAVPILLAIWIATTLEGALIAILSAVVWWWANQTTHPYHTTWGYALAAFSRLFFFVSLVIGGGAVKNRQHLTEKTLEALTSTKRKAAEMRNVCDHELRLIGRFLNEVVCSRLSNMAEIARQYEDRGDPHASGAGQDLLKMPDKLLELHSVVLNVVNGIFPADGEVTARGLFNALEHLVQNTQRTSERVIEVTPESAEIRIVDAVTTMHLYRIAQEALDNALRHGAATRVVISLQGFYDHKELRIEDNGRGLPPASDTEREMWMGIRTMQVRAEAIGAYFSILGRPGGGTSVCCRLTEGGALVEPLHSRGRHGRSPIDLGG